jgi:hypothetical protein
MAGDWIPIYHELPRRKEVGLIAADTGRSRHEVIGLLVDLWLWVDSESQDGTVTSVGQNNLPVLIGADKAFWESVHKHGWILIREDGISLPNWSLRNRGSRKLREQETLRKRKLRNSVPGTTAGHSRDNCGTSSATSTSTSRSLKSDVPKGTSSPFSTKSPPVKSPRVKRYPAAAKEIITLWNELAERHGLKAIERVSSQRLQHVRARLAEHPDLWSRLEASLASRGQWARDHAFPTFDQAMTPSKLLRLFEGVYGDEDGDGRLSAKRSAEIAMRAQEERQSRQESRHVD